MRNKIKINLANNPEAQLAYVHSRLKGAPAEQVRARYAPDSPNPYTDFEQVLGTLEAIYGDPNRQRNAQRKYQTLYQRTRPFAEFYADFQLYASMAGITHQDSMLADLSYKINGDLQDKMMSCQTRSLTEYAQECHRYDFLLQNLKATRSRESQIIPRKNVKPAAPTPVATAATTTPAAKSTPAVKVEGGTTPKNNRPAYSDPVRQALSSAGACFKCHMPGHLARDCPDKIKVVEEVLSETEEPGKGHP